MKVQLVLIALLFYLSLFNAQAGDNRKFLQSKGGVQTTKALLVGNQEWVPYPAYTDRVGWNKLSDKFKNEILVTSEKYLDFKWGVDFKSNSINSRSGSYHSNKHALQRLVMAELIDGNGRFMPDIVVGTSYFTEMISEGVPSSIAPDAGAMLAWIHYFFKDEFVKYKLTIKQNLINTINEQFLDRHAAQKDNLSDMVTSCRIPSVNFHLLTISLLMEDDPNKRAAQVHHTLGEMDAWLNDAMQFNESDEVCSQFSLEAAGSLFDYLQLLSYATYGQISIFDQSFIRKIGAHLINDFYKTNRDDNLYVQHTGYHTRLGVINQFGYAISREQTHQLILKSYSTQSVAILNSDIFYMLENLKLSGMIRHVE